MNLNLPRFTAFTMLLFMLSLLAVQTASADWPSWRGPSDSGSTDTGSYPTVVNEKTTLWKATLPGKGCSTPIVVDKTVFVTAPAEGMDALIAIDWEGKRKWLTKFGKEVAGKHRNGSGSNASPVSDGDAVYVYFKSGTLAAVEFDGSVRWKTNIVDRFGKDTLFWDHGTSPVLTTKHVVFTRMHKGESWLAAFDKQSGDMTWKVARNYDVPTECDHGYTTPQVMQFGGRESLLVWGAEHLTIHDAEEGSVNWSCGGFNPETKRLWPAIACPVVIGDIAVIAFGRNDKGAPRLHGVRLTGSGDVTKSAHIWKRDDVSTFVPSPVAYDGKLYLVRDRGQVECIDPETGETIWNDAFPKSRSNFYASPMIAAGTLFAPREDGVVFIAKIANGKLDLKSENDMQQPVIGSPVPSENRVLIRGEKELFCISAR